MGAARSIGLSGRTRWLRVGDAAAAGPHGARRARGGEAPEARQYVRALTRAAVAAVIVAAAMVATIAPLAGQSGAKNGEWRSYAADTGSTRYSPLAQIDATNFNKLEIAWRF